MAWYNQYRPKTFADVTGQSLVKSVLQNALAKNRIKHAYLFYGPKGVGKTTLARIFAAGLNDLEHNPEASIDTIEMDAASNTSIDDVRQLIESAKTPPLNGKFKIYIIDEVHMLSKPAMNALLKILEEPPIYLVFLLATTNPEKLIPTVLSRLTKLTLSSHTTEDIVQNLKNISNIEKVKIDEPSLKLIAKRSGGSLRDAINLLETVASYEMDDYDLSQTSQLLGLLPEDLLLRLGQDLLNQETVSNDLVSKIEASGVDGETFLGQFLDYLLSSSFEGQGELDNIILPIARILNLRLPITSIISSIALVQVEIASSGVKGSAEVKKKPEVAANLNNDSNTNKIAPEVTIQKIPDATPIVDPKPSDSVNQAANVFGNNKLAQDTTNELDFATEETNENIAIAETNQPSSIDHIKSNSQQLPTKSASPNLNTTNSTAEVTSEQILLAFRKITTLEDAPPIFKMIINDLSIESVSESKIILGVSNSIFLAQLNSPKLTTWIKDKLTQLLEQEFKIENKIRDAAKPGLAVAEKKQVLAENKTEYVAYNSGSASTSSSKPNINNTPKKKLPPGIFYEIYHHLPPNADPEKLKVFKGNIPKPNQTEDWDDHAGELFDFED